MPKQLKQIEVKPQLKKVERAEQTEAIRKQNARIRNLTRGPI